MVCCNDDGGDDTGSERQSARGRHAEWSWRRWLSVSLRFCNYSRFARPCQCCFHLSSRMSELICRDYGNSDRKFASIPRQSNKRAEKRILYDAIIMDITPIYCRKIFSIQRPHYATFPAQRMEKNIFQLQTRSECNEENVKVRQAIYFVKK